MACFGVYARAIRVTVTKESVASGAKISGIRRGDAVAVYCGLQVSFNNGRTLADLQRQQQAIIDRLDLPEDLAERLMQLGFLPGATVEAIKEAPGGDPCIYRIDGADIALRRDTARRLKVR